MSITKEQVTQLLGENNLSEDVVINLKLMVESAIDTKVQQKLNEQQSVYKETIRGLTEEVERLKQAGESYGEYVKNGYNSKINSLEENVSLYSEYAMAEHSKLNEQAEAYGKYVEKTMSERAEAYGQYLQKEFEKEQTKLSETAEAYGEYVLESLTDEVDQYLDYVVEQFISENKAALVESVEYKNMQSVFADMQESFSRHLFQLKPDNTIISVNSKLKDSINENNKTLAELATAKRKNSELQRKLIIEQATKSLTDTQKERIENLVERLKYSNETEFKRGVELMIEEVVTVPTKQPQKPTQSKVITESANQSVNVTTEDKIGINLFEVNATPANTPSSNDIMDKYISIFK